MCLASYYWLGTPPLGASYCLVLWIWLRWCALLVLLARNPSTWRLSTHPPGTPLRGSPWGSRDLFLGSTGSGRPCLYPASVFPKAFIMPRSKKGLGRCHKVEQGTIRVGGERLLVITRALIETTVTQRETSCHYRWYLFLFHWTIQSSIHLSCPQFDNSHPGLHITLLVITSALIAITVNQRAISYHHRWYLCFLHGIIQSSIQLSCPWLVNSNPSLHITQRMSCKILQYPVGLHLIRQIPCHRRPPIMEVTIFMDAWLMCLSSHHQNDKNMP